MNILEVTDLRVWQEGGRVIVPGSSFQVTKGSCLAVVGESGSGKSVSCRAVMRLNPPGIRQSGSILFDGINVTELSAKEMRKLRGKQMYMILQHGMRAFHPSSVIGVHLQETLARHQGWSRGESAAKIKQAMESVRLKDPAVLLNKYPHELSGGMLQRVMIALAIVLEPELIIADEPTTALDTISQYEVVEQLIQMRSRLGCSMIFVSHDLGIVRKISDEVLVMKDGEIIERGMTEEVLAEARHNYTRNMVQAKRKLERHFSAVMGGGGIADRSGG